MSEIHFVGKLDMRILQRLALDSLFPFNPQLHCFQGQRHCCHNPYCFPSQSQTIFQIGADRSPQSSLVITVIPVIPSYPIHSSHPRYPLLFQSSLASPSSLFFPVIGSHPSHPHLPETCLVISLIPVIPQSSQ